MEGAAYGGLQSKDDAWKGGYDNGHGSVACVGWKVDGMYMIG